MVSFKQSIVWYFTRWRDIRGRSTRAEFWWVWLAWIPYIFLDDYILAPLMYEFSLVLIWFFIFLFSTLIVRRCIDVGIPQLLGLLITYIPIFLVIMISLGTFTTFDDSIDVFNLDYGMDVLLGFMAILLSLLIFVISLLPSNALDRKYDMVSFKQSIVWFFTRWRDIRGRSTRAEFWWVTLAMVLSILVSFILELLIYELPIIYGLSLVVDLALIVPTFTLTVRRCNDIGFNMWMGIILQSSVYIAGFAIIILFTLSYDFSLIMIPVRVFIILGLVLFIITLIPSQKID